MMTNDKIIAFGKKVVEYVAIGAAFGTIGSYWINTEVERRMNELAQDPATHPTIVEQRTRLAGIEKSQDRIEQKVDAFATQFLAYLERQAE